jgi:polyferredoxin
MQKHSLLRLKPRHLLQLLIFVWTLAIGLQFYFYIKQAMGSGAITIPRPAGVEGFLPIGALMSWKRFFLTSQWDFIHPAAMLIFGFALMISFLFHKAFCSWFCPIGTLSEWAWKIGRKLFGKQIRLPRWLDYALMSIKYLLLGFFLWIILTMPLEAISSFINSPYYKLSDVKMLRFFTHMTITTGVVLLILIVGSLFIKNFWCRYFCPYGALTGFLGMISPSKITRNAKTCTDCGQCSKACPHRIDVRKKELIMSAECSACLDCVNVCSEKGTLKFESRVFKFSRTWSPAKIGVIITLSFFGLVGLGIVTGYWQTHLPESEFRELLKLIDSPFISHPGL